MHESSDDADWRKTNQRLSALEFIQRSMRQGKNISPIFSCFGVFNHLFRIDWLHAVDQGVGADFLGNLFCMLMRALPGRNNDERAANLWQKIQAYYIKHNIADRMKSFKYSLVRPNIKNPPKLKCSAACCRSLIHCGYLLAHELLGDSPLEAAAKVAAYHLYQCYQCLSDASVFRDDVFRESSKAFASQYKALYLLKGDGISWRVKPKMHLFLELCSEGSRPNLFWTYRDEDFGGSVAKQCRMRGMWKRLCAFSKHALDMFKMKNPVPRLV